MYIYIIQVFSVDLSGTILFVLFCFLTKLLWCHVTWNDAALGFQMFNSHKTEPEITLLSPALLTLCCLQAESKGGYSSGTLVLLSSKDF